MKRAVVLLVALVAAAGLVACGGDDSEEDTGAATTETTAGGGGGGGGAAQTLKVTADPSGQLAWSPTALKAKPGQVTLELDNPSPVPHNIEVEGNGVEEVSDTVAQDTTSVSVDLKPGEYVYYCAVPGHRGAGMEGTLTVQ